MKNKRMEILNKWEEDIKRDFEKLLPAVHEIRERIKSELSLQIWLGGPGPKHGLRYIRELIGELLKRQKFRVHFSEDYHGGGDLVSKEVEEIEASGLAIILAITPGASAEAVEFAHHGLIRQKIYVFVPEEYRNGYIVRSLFGKHRLIAEDSFFSLGKLQEHDSDLAIKVVNRAIDCRSDLYRKKKMEKCFGDPA